MRSESELRLKAIELATLLQLPYEGPLIADAHDLMRVELDTILYALGEKSVPDVAPTVQVDQ